MSKNHSKTDRKGPRQAHLISLKPKTRREENRKAEALVRGRDGRIVRALVVGRLDRLRKGAQNPRSFRINLYIFPEDTNIKLRSR